MTQFRMPAEWEPQDAMWFSWPWNLGTWPQNLAAARVEFEQLIRAVAADQQVNLLVPRSHRISVKKRFESVSRVAILEVETNDAWARDYAPTFVVDANSALVAVDWYYNGWGEKYPPFAEDQNVAKKVADHLNARHLAGGLCLEGGAIEVDGRGTLITTESCVLNSNRNAGLSKRNAEAIFAQRLGCKKIVWLPGDIDGKPALSGDDTDGHVDQLARFVDDATIVHAWCDESDKRFDAIAANVGALKRQLPQLRFEALPLPKPICLSGRPIPASYCNFLVGNRSVFVPQFGAAEDGVALSLLSSLFGSRQVVPLDSKNLSVGLGSFHCLSQQQPAID